MPTEQIVDLHVHSTASDGLFTPTQVVEAARSAGVTDLALTDHDTMDGIAEAAAALPAGMTLIAGAEISCGLQVNDDHRVSLHLLGYAFDPAYPPLAAALAATIESRVGRAARMAALLEADGHPVTFERVREIAGGVVGRPHVAAALVEAGLVPTVAAAFTPDWIGTRGRYWVAKEEPDVLDAIRLVKEAGGVTVFAHPYASKRGEIVGPDVIRSMAGVGLDGLETDHVDHDEVQRAALRELAAELELVVTGGSDFHGPSKPQGIAAETTVPAAYDALLARAGSGGRGAGRPLA